MKKKKKSKSPWRKTVFKSKYTLTTNAVKEARIDLIEREANKGINESI